MKLTALRRFEVLLEFNFYSRGRPDLELSNTLRGFGALIEFNSYSKGELLLLEGKT